jgi:hypothetical protein
MSNRLVTYVVVRQTLIDGVVARERMMAAPFLTQSQAMRACARMSCQARREPGVRYVPRPAIARVH